MVKLSETELFINGGFADEVQNILNATFLFNLVNLEKTS